MRAHCSMFALAAACALALSMRGAVAGDIGPPVDFTAEQDQQDMMRQLGIRELRPGPNGDEAAPNHANYDESLANPYPLLPDPLRFSDGRKVSTAETWWNERRPEIVEAFEENVYGRVPQDVPKVSWNVMSVEKGNVGGIPVIIKRLTGRADNSAYPFIDVEIAMTLVLPAGATKPVPVLMMFGPVNLPPQSPPPSTQEIIAGGWGFAQLDPTTVQADNGAGLTRGVIGLANKGRPRKPDDWGALRAWAWGASRGLDYLQTDASVDANHVGIEGVSRYGKAALVAMAFDRRFAAVLVGSSGKGGATLLRRNWGEAVESLTGGEYYWMAGNFMRYGAAKAAFGSGNPNQLPVDSHELIALCAPRLVFISYGIPERGDAKWLDHKGSYLAAVAAGPVFRLLGVKDLGVGDDDRAADVRMPPVNTGLLSGHLAWRQDDGGHTDAPNMKYFIHWVDGFVHHVPPNDTQAP